ncbi:MAG: tetratricopeptide repeat protein [Gammaproteobacteria bacterium]
MKRPPELTECLRQLQLLRNDPELVETVRPFAEQGYADAQYAMGLIYAEGRGVSEDPARAHYWLTLAVEQGDTEADLLRNIVGAHMTEEQYQASLRMRQGPGLRIARV